MGFSFKKYFSKKGNGKKVEEIDDLPHFIFEKQNTLLKKLLRYLQ